MRGKGSALRRIIAGGVTSLLLLTGCGTGTGTGDLPPSPSSSERSGSDGGGSTGRPTELPTDLRECPPNEKDAVDARVPRSTVPGYDVPAGFSGDGASLGQIADAEGGDYQATYHLYEQRVDVEVLAVIHYRTLAGGPVADACGRLDLDEVLARLADHNQRSGSEVTLAPALLDVAGVPAVVEERSYPGVGITVRHYWIYGAADMLNIQCQWTSHENEVRHACDELLATLTLG